MLRTAGFLALVFTIGCGPGLAADGSEGESGSDAGDGDGDTGDGDGAAGDGDGDGDTGDGDGDAGDGDGDGDTGSACGEQQLECPDGTCQYDLDEHPCCGHGGDCPAGCEPQMAASSEDACAEPLFAWTGIGCAAICACEGPDCGELYDGVGACLAAYEPTCGFIGLDTCPFEMQIGPTAVAGMTSYGANEYTVGAFGLIYGKGGGDNLNIALAHDLATLGNHLWNVWDPPPTADVLSIWGGNPLPGEYQVYVGVALPLSRGVMGTLTITSVVADGDFVDQGLWATLDASEGEWQLHGEFAIPGCQRLEQHVP